MRKTLFLYLLLIAFSQSFGQFSKVHTLKKNIEPNPGIAVGDMNGDGKLDIVSDEIFEQNGLFSFQKSDSLLSVSPGSCGNEGHIVKDLDFDGDSDIVRVNYCVSHYFYSIYRNNYPNSFYNTPDTTFLGYELQVADLNNDGNSDYIYLSTNRRRIYLFSDSLNGFSTRKTIADTNINGYFYSFYLVDVDNDGLKDIVPFTVASSSNSIWLKNYGNLNFSGNFSFLVPLYNGLEPLDFDSDGDVDILVDNGVGINNSGTFSYKQLGNGALSYRILVDIDSDNDLDIIAPRRDTMYLYLNSNNISFSRHFLFKDVGLVINSSGDFDNDGFTNEFLFSTEGYHAVAKINLTTFTIDTIAKIRFYQDFNQFLYANPYNTKQFEGVFNSTYKIFSFDSMVNNTYKSLPHSILIDSFIPPGSKWIRGFNLLDINNDGFDDIFVEYGGPYKSGVHLSQGNNNFSNYVSVNKNYVLSSFFRDIDNDNDLDVVLFSDSVYVYEFNNNNFIKKSFAFKTNGTNTHTISMVDDITGDGKTDILIPDFWGGYYSLFKGDGNFNFTLIDSIKHINNAFRINTLADLDGNNTNDIIEIIADSIIVFFNDSNGTTFTRKAYKVPNFTLSQATPIKVVDMNNDGFNDICYGPILFNDSNLRFYNQYYSITNNTRNIKDDDYDGDYDLIEGSSASSYGNAIIRRENYFNNKYRILGSVFYDANQNKSFDVGDYGFPNIKFENPIANYTGYSDNIGNINFPGKLYSNQIKTLIDTSLWKITTDSLIYNVYLDSVTPVKGTYNFGVYPKSLVTKTSGHITSTFTRCSSISKINIEAKNIGTSVIDTLVIEAVIDDSLSVVSFSVTADSSSGNKFYWSAYNLLPYNSLKIEGNTQNPGVSYIGKTLLSYINVYHHQASSNTLLSKDTVKRTLTCGYDPNFKEVKPEGIGNEHYVSKYDTLHYTLHFQNTGNDTAINILLVDRLSPFLDINSIDIIAASHNVNIMTEPDRDVLFRFNNIYLPDSGINQQASHGYVRFSVLVDSTVNANQKIENYVDIYFDLNPAVTTNKVFNTIECFSFPAIPVIQGDSYKLWVQNSNFSIQWYFNDTIIIGANSDTLYPNKSGNYTVVVADQYKCSSTSNYYTHFIVSANEKNNALFKVYPNPFRDKIVIENISFDYSEMLNIQVFDVMGKEILSTQINPNKNRSNISLEDISDGIYFITISSENKVLFYDKLIAK